LRGSLRVHDGQSSDDALFHNEWYLLPVNEIVLNVEFVPKSLIPFAANGAGDFLCVASGKAETSSVVQYRHEGDETETVSSSYRDWLVAVADDLQRTSTMDSIAQNTDAKSPNMDDLVRFIGMSIDDPEPLEMLMANGTDRDKIDGTVYLVNNERGFEVKLGKNGRIETIHLYCVENDEHSAFSESLSHELNHTDGRELVMKHYGEPTRSGTPNKKQGGFGGWDRFDNEQVCIRFGYRQSEPGINLISIMASDTAP